MSKVEVNAEKVERHTLKQKFTAQLSEKEKELNIVNDEMLYTSDFRTYKDIARKRASLTVDISTLRIKLKNLGDSKPLLGSAEGMGSNFAYKNLGVI